eukprot:TRINITY_DN8133_c0_g2_i2.p1 TRINITY_DN8133_c0_g2~~TRINITY_DN8133_c0_g2_i2.p1  ORF type:complete len:325 (-),score=64.83 TRINITY_DN8133_c0_g2_i2:293-1267(-)
MCIRDRYQRRVRGAQSLEMACRPTDPWEPRYGEAVWTRMRGQKHVWPAWAIRRCANDPVDQRWWAMFCSGGLLGQVTVLGQFSGHEARFNDLSLLPKAQQKEWTHGVAIATRHPSQPCGDAALAKLFVERLATVDDLEGLHKTESPRENSTTRNRKRKQRCGSCAQCMAPSCGECKFCIDRAGPDTLRKACVKRFCAMLHGPTPEPAKKSRVEDSMQVLSPPQDHRVDGPEAEVLGEDKSKLKGWKRGDDWQLPTAGPVDGKMVDWIVDRRLAGSGNEVEYLVQWEQEPMEAASWVPSRKLARNGEYRVNWLNLGSQVGTIKIY